MQPQTASPLSLASGRPLARRPSDRSIRLGCFALLVAWVFAVGKDYSWDVQNHHLYLPFSWLTGRRLTDLFGAGPQSYQYPLGYFPLYAMVVAGWPSWLVGLVLAAVHALVIWPIDRLCRVFWPRGTDEDFWLRLLALAFSLGAPIFMVLAGTTSIDPFAALPILWACVLTLEPEVPASRLRGARRAFVVGVLLGLACVLKLSNALFALSVSVLWVCAVLLRDVPWQRLVAGGLGMIAAFVPLVAPWMYWLWRDFGNPVFPLANHAFHSPFAPDNQSLVAMRFVAASWLDYLARIPEMASPSAYVVYESFLPDLRPLLSVAALSALVVSILLRGRGGLLAARATWSAPAVRLALLLTLGYVLWMRSSGNARYAAPLLMLLGVGLVRVVQELLPLRAARSVLLLALTLQSAYFVRETQFRFHAFEWDRHPYLRYEVPQRLREQPFLHLIVSNQTDASVAVWLDPRGAMANVIGQMSLPVDGPLGARLETLLDRWQGRTRILFPRPAGDGAARMHAGMSALLYRFDLDVDWNDCENIDLAVTQQDEAYVGRPDAMDHGIHRLTSCAAVRRPRRDPATDRAEAEARRVLDAIEAACPSVFAPRPMAVDHAPDKWIVNYPNTDARLAVTPDGVFFEHPRIIAPVWLGRAEDILSHHAAIKCPNLTFQTPG